MSKRKTVETTTVETVEPTTVEACETVEVQDAETVENTTVQTVEPTTVETELAQYKEELSKLNARIKYVREAIATLSGHSSNSSNSSKMSLGRVIVSEMAGERRKDVLKRLMDELSVGKPYASTMYALIKKGK